MEKARMTVNPRITHRCDYADECGKPRTGQGRKAERRAIKRAERNRVLIEARKEMAV